MEESVRVVLKKCEKNIRFKRLTNLPFVSTRRPALGAPVATSKLTDVLFDELVFFSRASGIKKTEGNLQLVKTVLIQNKLEAWET